MQIAGAGLPEETGYLFQDVFPARKGDAFRILIVCVRELPGNAFSLFRWPGYLASFTAFLFHTARDRICMFPKKIDHPGHHSKKPDVQIPGVLFAIALADAIAAALQIEEEMLDILYRGFDMLSGKIENRIQHQSASSVWY